MVGTPVVKKLGIKPRHRVLEGVSLIAIDETWSCMRFRPATDVRSHARAKA